MNSQTIKRKHNLSETIRLLHCKIPIRFDQQRILEQFPFTDETIDKLVHMVRDLNIGRVQKLQFNVFVNSELMWYNFDQRLLP